jgi:hypothetical protein
MEMQAMNNALPNVPPRVRVIMPIGSDPEFQAKQAAIARGAARARFAVEFPDYEPAKPQFRLSEFLNNLRGASAVLADLTGERPSCYFELGIAETLDLPVYLIAKTGTPIHQSGGRAQTFFYGSLDEMSDIVADLLSSTEGSEPVARAV